MGTEKATSTDVARLAGVSQATVSRVFTAGSRVSPALRHKVEGAAEVLGYRPNTLARAMITGRSRTIGVVLAYLDNPFYSDALERLSNALDEEGYHILVFFASNHREAVDPVVEKLIAHQVEGIILASVSMSSGLTQRLQEVGIPFVLFNRGQEGAGLAMVTSANVEGGRKAARFLLEGGHQRIAHISGWLGSLTGRERQAGFLAALEEAGVAPVAVADSRFDRARAVAITEALLASTPRPDAIFAGNDHMAFAVMETVRGLGLKVPDDVSIVGYDDVSMAAWPTFDLTTLRQPVRRMIRATTRTLMAMIEGRHGVPRKIEIESELIVRGSARRPPAPRREYDASDHHPSDHHPSDHHPSDRGPTSESDHDAG